MKMRRLAAIAACVIAPGALALAGPLDPPAGPITPTAKPLAEVEPRIAINTTNTPGDATAVFRITQPGSYYLTGNLVGESGKGGIVVATPGGVRIDLNGFTLGGVPGAVRGIDVAPAVSSASLVVSNGFVAGWNIGISAGGGGRLVNLDNIIFRANATGAQVDGAIVAHCHFYENTLIGLSIGSGVVDGCIAERNSTSGFSATSAEFRNCRAIDNGANGYSVSGNSSFVDCVARGNDDHGFVIASGSAVLTGCVAEDSGLEGIRVTGTNAAATIRGCLARFNAESGIRVTSGGIVEGNTLYNNGSGGAGAGILVAGSNNRIEGNNCTGADFGIKIDAAGNVVARNVCSDNTTNWSIVAGNAVAPIVAATVNGAAISGNAYAGSLGSTDPNANFTY